MKHPYRLLLALACVVAVVGCGKKADRQRTEILTNQQRMRENLRQQQENQEAMLRAQEDSKRRQEELLRIGNMGVTNQKDILSLVRDNNALGQANNQTLQQTFQEVYGVGVDLRAAIGETRVVIAVNDRQPLRVHSAVPGSQDSEVIDKLPIGAVIFQAKKMTDKWWRGVIFKEDEKMEIVFAAQFTKPLRDELMPETPTSMTIGERPTH